MPIRTFVFAALIGCFFPAVQAAESDESTKAPTPEAVKQEAQANTKYLAANALKKAKAIIDAYGQFAPFGAGLFADGEVKFVWAVKPGESIEGVNPVLVLNTVRKALATQAATGRILASAVVYQYENSSSDNGDGGPQVNVELEYLNGYAEVIGTRYEQSDDGIEYTTSGHRQYEPRIFTEGVKNVSNP